MMRPLVRCTLNLALLVGAALPVAGQEECEPPALRCAPLIPAPAVPSAGATVRLSWEPSPFGVAVTASGAPRRRLLLEAAGLPEPSSLGPYTAYVAWSATVAMDSLRPLGPVTNGVVDLGIETRTQFRLLVSAEARGDTRERRGPWVLRGVSPEVRLLAHRDLAQPAAPGALRDAGDARGDGRGDAHDHAHGHAPALAGGTDAWPMPWQPEWFRAMPAHPGPDVAPYRPADDSLLPAARAPAVWALADGDTIRLPVARVRDARGRVAFAYAGMLPGPALRVPRGAHITAIVENLLDQPTAVHWHGLRLANAADGVPGVTQAPIPPGGSHVYTLSFPDAGVYWYHPHVREDIQLALGLAGAIVVTDAAAPAPDVVLLLGDEALGADGAPLPFGAGAATHALSGRHGTRATVNAAARWDTTVAAGTRLRVTFVNAANARPFNLSFTGASMTLRYADAGPVAPPLAVPSVVASPSERWTVEVAFDAPGAVPLVNQVLALDHMAGVYRAVAETLGVVQVLPADGAVPRSRPEAAIAADPALARLLARAGDALVRALTLGLDVAPELPAALLGMLGGQPVAVEWTDGMPMANQAFTARRARWWLRDGTGAANEAIAWRFRVGDVVRLRLANPAEGLHSMAHPIHLHGERFVVLSRNGVRQDTMVWKDTALLPAGEEMELLVEFTNPGRWMLHCHIAEHLSSGMMTVLEVEP